MQYEEIKKLCNELKVDFNQLFILKSINDNAEDDYQNIRELTNRDDVHKHNIEVLCNKKYVQLVVENNQLSFIDVIKCQIPIGFEHLKLSVTISKLFTPVEKIDTFCERMYLKFPAIKIPTSRKPLKSGLTEFSSKLNRFIKEHKFSLETIEKAIDLYIIRGNQANWQYFQTAGYFIYKRVEKEGETSALESYCEEVKDMKKEDIVNIISGQINLFSNDI